MSDQATEFVYLIGSEESVFVKIGRSVDVQTRLAAIQRMSPAKLTVLWRTEGGAELETALHRRFKAQRSHGEWFEFPDRDAPEQVVQAIAEMAAEAQKPQTTSLAGHSVGDVVLITRDGWRYSKTGVIRAIWGGELPFIVEENDGRRHRFLVWCTKEEIARQDAVAERPRGARCDGIDCMCSSVRD